MKFMQSLSSRLSALLMLALTLSTSFVHAEIVEPRYGYYFMGSLESLGAAGAKIYAYHTGMGQADYWSFIEVRPRNEPYTINGLPKLYSVWVKPTDKNIKENNIPPGEYEWQGAVRFAICPAGFTSTGEISGNGNINGPDFYVSCYRPEPCSECDRDQKGNPVAVSTGVKTETAVDYQGAPGLEFSRNYRSDRQGWSHNFSVAGLDIAGASSLVAMRGLYAKLPCVNGIDTQFNKPFCFPQVSPAFGKPVGSVVNEFILLRGHSRMRVFGTANDLTPPADINDRIIKLQNAGGSTTGWSVYNANNESTEYFDLTGKLIRIVERNGMQKQFTYSEVSTPLAAASTTNLLTRVTNHFGQQLNFTYDALGRMWTMTDPNGGITTYAYDGPSAIVLPGNPLSNNLTSVTYPDGKKRVYWYNEQDKTNDVDLPFALTGIADENGARFATWTYDAKGHAISSEHAGGVEKYIFSGYGLYQSPNFIDPLGVNTEYGYTVVLNQLKLYFEKRTAGASVLMKEGSFDARGNISILPDNKGNRTSYTYDARNLQIKRVDAMDSPSDSITTTTSWHPQYRIPVQVNTPLLKTSYTHDTNGNVLTKTEQATSDTNGSQGASAPVVGNARTWTYTYNTIGQVLTVTGPRTDVVDKTTYTYDNLGNLSTVTNAAGHVTTLSNYDANSRVGQITDPNGMVTTLTYTPRGWLKQRVTNADGVSETTTYDYDGVGQMTKVTLPDNSYISYTYDDAHRLTKITDNLGNSINYTLDVMGNRTNETVKDSNGNLTRQVSRVYDILNRLQTVTGAAQ